MNPIPEAAVEVERVVRALIVHKAFAGRSGRGGSSIAKKHHDSSSKSWARS